MSNPWALWRKRLIDNAQLAFAMQAKLAKEVAFMRHRSTRLLNNDESLGISTTVDDLEAALEQFREIANDLGGEGMPKKTT